MSKRSWTVRLPDDLPAMSSNDRKHWAERNRSTQEWREAVGWSVKAERVLRLERANVVLYAWPPDHRRRDAHNLAPCLKAAVDGCVDAGVLDDDDVEHLPISYVQLKRDPDVMWRWALRIEEA